MLHDGLCIATSAYQNYSTLPEFFDSLKKQINTRFHVYLTDVTPEPQTISIPSFCTLLHSQNKGYAAAVNNGIQMGLQSKYNKFCIVNNDVIFAHDFVENALESLNNNPGTLIGGKIYYAPGYEYHTSRYKKEDRGKVLWYAGGAFDYDHAIAIHQGVDEVDSAQFSEFKKTEFITGCLMCFDKTVIDDIGLMDESYFLYYEDADYSARANKCRLPLLFDPSIRLWHKNSQSTGGSGSKLHMQYQRKNRLKFALRYAPLRTKFHIIKNYFLGE